jgi:DNA-binding GntR family transcriptional regulator
MNTESTEPQDSDGVRLERAIVLQLLRDDRPERWERAELGRELGVRPSTLRDAIAQLSVDEVVYTHDEALWVARPVRRVDELGLIGV